MLPPQSSRQFATSIRMRWMKVLPDSTSDAAEAEEIAGPLSDSGRADMEQLATNKQFQGE